MICCLLVACGGGGGGSGTGPTPAAANNPPDASSDDTESPNDDNAGSDDKVPNTDEDGAGPGDDQRNTDDGIISNSSPSIAGTPRLSVVQNTIYELVVSATDPDGDPLTFIASNKPDWASFNPVTGVLVGVPMPENLGTTDDVSIGVTDGMLTSFLPPFSITVYAFGHASVTVSWTIPTTNEDGSPLTDLAGFKVYYGNRQGVYPESTTVLNPGVSSLVVDNLSFDTTYYFAVVAIDEFGNESEFSEEVSKAF